MSTHWPGLAKLAEECAELQQVLMKIVSTGGRTDGWLNEDYRKNLLEELADVQAAIEFFVLLNITEEEEATIVRRQNAKQEYFARLYNSGDTLNAALDRVQNLRSNGN